MAKRQQAPRRQSSAPQPHAVAETPKSLWQQPLKADFKSFFKALGSGVAHFLAGNKTDLIADAVDAGVAIGVTMPPEQLAGRLVERSLLRAVVALVQDAVDVFFEFDLTEEKAVQIAGRLKMTMDDIPVLINRDFFDRPGEMPVVQVMQATLRQWLRAVGLKPGKAEGLSARLPGSFTFALQEEWRRHRSTYQPLCDAQDTPFWQASERAEQWNFYTAWLIQQADQRMFDETFSLRQVYVRLRASFAKGKGKTRVSVTGTGDPETSQQQVVWLDECLADWLEKWDRQDAIRVLSGGPGSGKSAFARMFAAEVARRGRCRVIYVPLHLFELKADLVAAVHGFCESNPYLPKNVLDAGEGEQRLLLIFDGLDELEKQGRMAAQVASDFVNEVLRAVDRLNQAQTRLMVLLCGRPVAVQAGESILRRDEQILHLLPYVLTNQELETYEDPLKLLPTDQRDEWWSKYGRAVERSYNGLPEPLQQDDFREITAHPLLNYLVALSFDRGKIDFNANVNLNVVYRDLLEAVYERGYEKRRSRSIGGLDFEKFVRVLEEIGLAAWHGDGRTTTVRRIQSRCSKSRAVEQTLMQFAGDAESGVTRLLTAFYFRQHGIVDGEQTFEFTHKSFGEYLTACRIVRELRTIHEELSRRDQGSEGGIDEAQALERWVDLTGPSEITHELHRFLRQEVATRAIDDARAWQVCCVRLINRLLRQGMPMEKLSPQPRFKEMDRQSRNAEESLLATLNACAEHTEVVSEIHWPNETSFGNWLSRLSPQRQGPENRVVLGSLSLLHIPNQHLHIRDLYGANFNRSVLYFHFSRYVCFATANLTQANLEHSDLRGANLQEAQLVEANLATVNLVGATLARANLRGANLRDADLRDADLTDADLRRTDLTGADLTGVVGLPASL